jgi:FdhE protein
LKSSWDLRIARAGELIDKKSAASEVLKFYQQLARFQQSIHRDLASAGEHDVSMLMQYFSPLLSLVKQFGSPVLHQAAEALEKETPQSRLELVQSIWQQEPESRDLAPEFAFFAKALLQPYAEFLSERTVAEETDSGQVRCPFCASAPQFAVLRPEGDGGKRSLVCSLCFKEWTFRRLVCPGCGEENKDKLPVFIAEDFNFIRVEACDTCHTYIKSFDLTKDGRVVPVVDELASVSLNLWAAEHKYQKLAPNLFGV